MQNVETGCFYEGRKYVLNNFTRINIGNSSMHRHIVAKLIAKQLSFAKNSQILSG